MTGRNLKLDEQETLSESKVDESESVSYTELSEVLLDLLNELVSELTLTFSSSEFCFTRSVFGSIESEERSSDFLIGFTDQGTVPSVELQASCKKLKIW